MTAQRIERDSFGEIHVEADRLWGASTQRSLQYFAIGADRMPLEVVWALALTECKKEKEIKNDQRNLPCFVSKNAKSRCKLLKIELEK